MVKEAAQTTVVANATRQAQVEMHLPATNAEAVVENQAKLQAVANAQRHQTKAAKMEKLKKVKVVEVEEISWQSRVGSQQSTVGSLRQSKEKYIIYQKQKAVKIFSLDRFLCENKLEIVKKSPRNFNFIFLSFHFFFSNKL